MEKVNIDEVTIKKYIQFLENILAQGGLVLSLDAEPEPEPEPDVAYSRLKLTRSNKKLNNPARGFYVQIDSKEKERLEDIKKAGIRVSLVAFDIREYLDKMISEDKLAELDNVLKMARNQGIRVVFRAAYDFDGRYKDPDSLERVYSHIKQIAPIINKNKACILCVQAGFLGPWGEWHSTKFVEGVNGVKDRNSVLETLLVELDESIEINLRRPRFIRDAMDAGISIKRIGFHNDGLLSTSSTQDKMSLSGLIKI